VDQKSCTCYIFKLRSSPRVHTSANAKHTWSPELQKRFGIQIQISGSFPKRSGLNSLPCRHQSFHQVSWKAAGDSKRNAYKSPRMFCLSRSAEGHGKVIRNPYPGLDHHHSYLILPTARPNDNTKFQWSQLIPASVILSTDTQTHKPGWLHNPQLFGRGNNFNKCGLNFLISLIFGTKINCSIFI